MSFRINKPLLIVLVFGLMQGCSWQNKSSVHERLFPEMADTTDLLALPTSTTEEYRQQLVNQEILLANDQKRHRGMENIPQDFDDFRFQNLDGVQWQNASVMHGDFRGTSLRTANANGGNFSHSDFRLADLRWSAFNNTEMNNCNFSQAVLFRTAMNDAVLDSSDFRGSNMFGVKGHRSSFRYADFSNALMKESELTDADFSNSRAIKVKFIITVFAGSRFDSADYSYCDFTGAGLETCSFQYARLHHVSFKGAHLQEASFRNADLKNAEFFAAELVETDFRGALNIPEALLPFINDEGFATGVVY
ncbi:MAG: pentapeptide repeat-containing protein [Bacteroidales bacterium]|nr:pentapeptide repeat-containing protein [Bacteroidales bacterium]